MAMTRVFMCSCVVLLATTAGCCGSQCGSKTKHDVASLNFALDKAAHKIQAKYHSCLPAAYNAETFIADLKKQEFAEDSLQALQAVSLEVWTDANCASYVAVARDRGTQDVLIWDKSSTRLSVDGQSEDGKPPPPAPVHGAQPSCSCVGAGPNP